MKARFAIFMLLAGSPAQAADLLSLRADPSLDARRSALALEGERDLRRAHGQSSLFTEAEYQARNRDVANRVVKEFQDSNLKSFGKRAEAYFLAQDLGPFRMPVAAAVFLAGVYTGRELKKNLGGGTRLRFRTEMRSRGGHYVGLDSPFANAEAAARTPEGNHVSVTKELPVVAVRTGVRYNLTQRSLATTAARNVAPGLDLVVDHRADRDPESALRLVYGIQF